MLLWEAPVAASRPVGSGYHELTLEAPAAARDARPGRFLHLLCGPPPGGDGMDRYLRRPLSIFRADAAAGTVSVLFRVQGEGTRWLAARRPGEAVSALGPLGRGFPLPGEIGADGPALLVGGGVGMPPLCFLAAVLRRAGAPVAVFQGARSAAHLLAEEELAALGVPLAVATDDGSRGHRGPVTDLLAPALEGAPAAVVYACGPLPMLRAVQRLAAARPAAAYLSVEQTMACGVGACLGCPVPVAAVEVYPPGPEPWRRAPRGAELAEAYRRLADAARGLAAVAYRRVCLEGPVFAAWEVVLA